MDEKTETKKCPKCRCYRLTDEFINSKGRVLKTCSFCREAGKKYREKHLCPHGKQKAHCPTCKEIFNKAVDF